MATVKNLGVTMVMTSRYLIGFEAGETVEKLIAALQRVPRTSVIDLIDAVERDSATVHVSCVEKVE